ncbi:30S ribosomal protein S8 [Thermogladius calderae 1633]|uniref:Small ribosomal subunit protein eS8 n=1 Tax=Thermogladius calderae (strain DSM 22663 / VKM B-2946 / 1633) TaxID=1184251 RepID=I3TCK0_THEC1|nr:30S ribosomal protein S8e [Thermogladius calderae]AFK50488.1 30S ribosomal protein S8 [Thermogladius calderae 1633]
MSYYQGNDFKKITGGKKGRRRDKRKYELGGSPINTTLAGEEERKIVRTVGGNTKVKLKRVTYVNVYLPEEKRVKRVKILDVVNVPSNPQLARSKIIVKGAIVKTEVGLVKILSRPGQDGVLNGVLVK